MTEILRVDEVSQAGKPRSLKQTFGGIRDLDELKDKFVFYNPLTCHLVTDRDRLTLATDLTSHILAQYIQEHPLVITDLEVPVLTPNEGILLNEFHKSFRNKLYAVPRDVWNTAWDEIKIMAAADQVTEKLNVLIPVPCEIPNPLGEHRDTNLTVYYYNCYSNRLIYYHAKEEGQVPCLNTHIPLREFCIMATQFFKHMKTKKSQVESASQQLDTYVREYHRQNGKTAAMQAMQMQAKLARPLNESELNHEQRIQCRDIIEFYESIFGKPDERSRDT